MTSPSGNIEWRAAAGEGIWTLTGNEKIGLFGAGSGVFRRENGTWKTFGPPNAPVIRCIAAAGPHDIWIVGVNGYAAHYTGTGWHVESVGSPAYVDLISVAAWHGEVWVAAAGPEIYHRTAQGWSALHPASFGGSSVNSLWAIAGGPLCAVLQPQQSRGNSIIAMFDGVDWKVHPLPGNGFISTVNGAGPADIVAVGYTRKLFGQGAQIATFNGTSWQPIPSPQDSPLTVVAVSKTGDAFAGGMRGITVHRLAGTWQPGDTFGETVQAVIAGEGGNVWYATGNLIVRR